jgi:hypothetical protein
VVKGKEKAATKAKRKEEAALIEEEAAVKV